MNESGPTTALYLEIPRGDAEACCSGAGMKSQVPDGEDEFRIADGEGARKMYCVGASKGVTPG